MSDSTENDARYRAEFQAQPAYAKTMTETEYVSVRRVDDGLDTLKPGSGEKIDPVHLLTIET